MENETDEYVDPDIKELRERVGVLEQEVKSLRDSAAQRQINDFKLAENDTGELLYPQIKELREVMGDLIISQHADSLEAAYEMAGQIQGNN